MNVYLDGTLLVHPPLGLEEIDEVIDLDLELHGYVLMFNFPLTFIKDGFDYIYDKKIENGFCSRIEVRIEVPAEQGTNIAIGYFFLTDCKFNHTAETVETEITDATYGVFISEAKDLKISPAATVTRSGEVLVPVPATDITLFTPSTGSDLGTDAKMYEVADTYEHMVKYLSDNGLQFSQTYFGGTFDFYFSRSYYMFNRGTAPDVQFSFRELAIGLFKLFGLWFKLDNSTIPATFTLVQGEQNFFESYGGITLPDIRDLIEEFYPERFFSNVQVGDGEALIERGSTFQLPTVPLVGFSEETFNAANDCALNNTLDLKSEWIIDHNRIERIVTSTDDTEEAVLVYANTSTGNAHKGTYGKTGAMRYYNEELLNFKVLNRHDIGTVLSQALGADTDSFRAYRSTDQTYTADGTTVPYPFDEDTAPGFDTGGNYDNVAFRYIIPTTGSYKFLVNLEYLISAIEPTPGGFPGSGSLTITVTIRRRQTGTGTILQQTEVLNLVHLVPTATNVVKQGAAEFFAEATDFIDVSIDYDFLFTGAGNSWTVVGSYVDSGVQKGSYFATAFVFNNGGTADLADLMDYRATSLTFEDYPITAEQWVSFKNNPSQGIYINNGGNNTLCWIKNISRNLKTGKATCQMISSPILTQL